MTAHGPHGTVMSKLVECVYAPSAVALRTGHRSLKSRESYKNLHEWWGLRQQTDLFFSTSETIQSVKRSEDDKHDDEKSVSTLGGEKGISLESSPKRGISLSESQVHARASSNSRPVYLSNGA